ncbi:MAG: Rieske (2Fe-2S) protein [Polyangiaceae bacterium]
MSEEKKKGPESTSSDTNIKVEKDDGHVPEVAASPEMINRRRVLARVSFALAACGAVAVGGPVIGFVIAPLLSDTPRTWRAVGKLTAFKIGETVNVAFVDASPLAWAGVTAKSSAWLRRVSETDFIAFSVNCAHLGCPVRWLADAQLFMCPCHGGVYYADGSVAAGPPPHPLTRYPVRINADDVEIHTDAIPIG